MRARVRRRLLLALLALPVAWACGREITIPDDVTPDAGPGEDAGADVAVDAIPDDAGLDVADVTCPLVTPDESAGVFVAPSGVNGASCGTKSAPCKTIAFGITRAVDKPTVYVARGTYVEHVTLKKDLEIVGGWDVTAGAWSRSCIEPEDATVIRAPSAERVTVEARDLGGEARLTFLRIESKGQSQVGAGESLYGVVATGASTSLALSNVRIEVVGAGSGTNGRSGDAGAPAPNSCAAGTSGANGPAGAQGAGADVGAFDQTGYVPAIAAAGGAGGAADNGAPGGAGSCVQCGTCGDILLDCPFIPNAEGPSCGKDGSHGCAGGSGAPGGPATGGGSSIGLYAWDATVTVDGGRIRSGDAGNGGNGGSGGPFGLGTRGQAGTATELCIVKCEVGVVDCVATTARGDGGTAGGDGGIGGIGGAGGGGGGGSSFAIYQGGAGVVTTSGGASLLHGKAGAGGGPAGIGAGAPGAAAPRVP